MTEQNLSARLILISQIRPDPTQPRRLLSLDLAEALAAGASPLDILAQLRFRAERDKWTRERVTELDALAGSIAADGLMQPIRVIPNGDDRYRIEEGERRWWSHHILVQQGKEQFQNIAAFVVEKESASSGLLRRRVAENVLRSDFAAIELARAMASRIQEILAAEPGTKRGDAERRVGSENGMSDRRVRQFVALLTLSLEVQELAQQARLSENSLRPIVSIKDAARQLAAVRELMHPSQKKAGAHVPSRINNHSKPKLGSYRRDREQRKRARVTIKPSMRHKSLTRKSVKKAIQRNDKSSALLRIQRLLSLAKSFKAKDSSRIGTSAWTRVVRSKTDRNALSNLHAVLGRGMEVVDRAGAEGAATHDG